jgi:hypothetical protein
VPGKLISENFLFDSLTALGLMIAFYYAFTGFACVVYYRREIPKTLRNFVFIGLAPGIGAVLLSYIFVKALFNFSDPANSYTGEEWFGVAPPAVIGVGMLLLGVILMLAWRLYRREPFFKRRPEVADPALLEPKPAPGIAGGASSDGRQRLRRALRRASLRHDEVRRACCCRRPQPEDPEAELCREILRAMSQENVDLVRNLYALGDFSTRAQMR